MPFRFQYIICCWFKLANLCQIGFFPCFNTLYVVGSKQTKQLHQVQKLSFNTLYVVGSIYFKNINSYLTAFQYIICCWFKQEQVEQQEQVERFNTLYVVGSTSERKSEAKRAYCFNTLYVVGSKFAPEKVKEHRLFQYIICCWFNELFAFQFLKWLLFQYIICCWFKLFRNYQRINQNMFQYIICCWFNQVD